MERLRGIFPPTPSQSDYQLLPSKRSYGLALKSSRVGVRSAFVLTPLLVLGLLLWATRAEPPPQPVQQLQDPTPLNISTPLPLLFPPVALDTPAFLADNNCALRHTITTLSPDQNHWESPSVPLPLSASLSSRIAAWRLASPSAPRAVWTAFNAKACDNPSVRRTANRVHAQDKGEKSWSGLSEEAVREVRQNMIGALEDAEREGRLGVREAERGRAGIVFTAGNADTFERVIVSLRMIRSYGTTLPVEVFHFPGEKPTSAQMYEFNNRLNATVREVQGLEKNHDRLRTKSFHIKGAALVQCDFEEFVYLDSDSIPVADVTPLFITPGYLEFGAMFWPDFWKDQPENAIWSILGVQCRDEWTQEAGQIVLSKAHHLDAMILVSHMLSSANWPFFFTLSDGDKDLFRYAFLALRKRWAVPGRHVESAGWRDDNDLTTKRFCGTTMVQYGVDGEPLFVHANLLKRIGGQFTLGHTWGRTRALSSPAFTILPPPSSLPPLTPLPAHTTQADHLTNTDSQGIGLVLAPPAVRTRAARERGLGSFFHQGDREGNYVLCVDSGWVPDPVTASTSGEEKEEECERVERIGFETPAEGEEQVGEAAEGELAIWPGGMEMRDWRDDKRLKGFEQLFYDSKGVANGGGFRR